jgi:eukaryotic-like serine/threonine-protein kinase
MSQLLRCPAGHQWEASPASAAADSTNPNCCPHCGTIGTEVGEHESPDDDRTFVLPGGTPRKADAEDETVVLFEAAPAASPAPADQTLQAPLTSGAPAKTPVYVADLTEVDAGSSVGLPPLADAGSELTQAAEPTAARGEPPPTRLPAGAWTRGDLHDVTGVWKPDLGATRHDVDENLRAAKAGAIPGYEILSELGRGAMGVVYRARQFRPNRIVALKMILSGGHASRTELARFRAEAEAVARLHHPNIVQVYEVGEQDGNPFFSLEYVEGESLHKAVGGMPQPARRAAELTRALAVAMEAAHERGIIHRDLKPANILLTREGSPKITDFGLAKRIDEKDSGTTRTGAILGTPSYMAPEQAQGRNKETGPQADIYALGAILYDLLTGRPPFCGETVLDTLEQVRRDEPVPPSRLIPRVPRDLETICLKALAKEPHRRYARAADLAADLDRFLGSMPILARPTSVWERAVKWAGRHPAAAALTAVSVLAILSVLTFGGLWLDTRRRAAEANELQQTVRADIERTARQQAEKLKKEADDARDAANIARQQAEANFQDAQDAVNQMLTSVGYEQLAYEPHMEKVRQELLVKALAFYERFLKEKSSNPAIRFQTGRAQQRVAEIQDMLGQHEPAEKAYRGALTLLIDLNTQFPDNPDYRRELAASYNNLGNLLKETGRVALAERAYRDALTGRQQLAKAFPESAVYRLDLAGSYNNLGWVLKSLGQPRAAEEQIREGENLLAALHQQFPTRPAYAQELASHHNNHGTVLALLGKNADAAAHFAAADKLYQDLVNRFPAVPDYRQGLAVTHKRVADFLRDTDPRKAEKEYRLALKLRQSLVADFPTVPTYRQEEAASHANLAVLLQAAGRQEEADKEYAEALAIRTRVAKDFPRVPDYRRELASTYVNQGNFLLTSSRLREAEDAYRRAHDFFAQLVAHFPDVPDYQQELAGVHVNLASLLASAGQNQAAEESYRDALKLQETLAKRFPQFPGHRFELATIRLNLGTMLQVNGKLVGAEGFCRAAVVDFGQLAKEMPGVPDYRHELAVSQNNLATLLRSTKRLKEAEDMRLAAIEVLEKLADELPEVASYRQELAQSQNELGILLALAGRVQGAFCLWAKVLDTQSRLVKQAPTRPDYRRDLAATYRNLGILAAQRNWTEDAEKNYREAIAVLEALSPKLPQTPAYYRDLIINHNNLATLLTTLDQAEEAIQNRRRVVELEDKLVQAFPRVVEFRGDLARSLHDLAKQLFDNEDEAEGIRYAGLAVQRQEDLIKLKPADRAVQQVLVQYRFTQMTMLVETGAYADAAAAASEAAKAARDEHRLAAILARCAGLAQKDNKLPEARRSELAQGYGDRALELLRRARHAGFKDLASLNNNKDFDPLRARADFQQLVRELTP